MSLAEFDADVVVDARDCIMGRVASNVAERALDGETIAVVNAEQAVITGTKEDIFETYNKRAELGSDSGPYYPKRPDGVFKRAIRGMLPYKQQDGREAFENVRVYVGNPFDEDSEVIEGTSLDRLSTIRFVTVGEVSKELGANVTW
ncbi:MULTISPECIES: 50S ribosomal protein L13 [Halobacterium]|jgi:large subunit ribosomal protein L13|uniref:50S ribosomal protein L13 n=1 Tax=Halobacterium TaxID=2239 RepID=UPI001E493AD4|nr:MULTISPECIES: 50S ribosomal protein L13 [Halobacterium]MCD2199793.1 50S ribosomal protein L13 [Halobacterium sp. KA-4]MCD2204145.1 50S ribosomal protein L13 [Halobacterium sp. KA-6]UHH24507.1 50S ribosomal protein L13 [Halobacterium noricense]